MGKEEVNKKLLFLLVLLVIGGVFLAYNQTTFTGLSVGEISEFDNQGDCEFNNYTWENLIETYCNYSIGGCTLCEPDDCVKQYTEILCTNLSCEYNCTTCNETDCSDLPDCTLCEPDDCVKQYAEILCTNLSCEYNCTECKEIVIGGQCVGELCGNGVLDEGEECDDENENETDSCNNCVLTICGDGIIQNPNSNNVSEVCDDGIDYNGEYSYCADDCLSEGPYCGDGTCDDDEDCDDCEADCGECEDEDDNPDSPGDSGGEEIPSTTLITTNTITDTCTPSWECGEWQECIDGTQARVCTDVNNCGSTEGMLETSRSCDVIVEETCFDGIQNQGEEGIDCGGPCEKQCSLFTMVGSAISGPIDVGKKFILEDMFGDMTRTIISTSILVFVIGGFITFFILSKKKIISMKKLLDVFNKKKESEETDNPSE